MASSTQPPANGSRSALNHLPPSSSSFLLDKAKIHARQSTPDSEALASSDDDQDSRNHHTSHITASEANHPAPKMMRPTRRTSWLNELPAPNRKSSFTGASAFSPANSQPSTPSGDVSNKAGVPTSVQTQTVGRTAQMPSSLNWGTGIWSNDSRKDPPARLAEVIPSPTSVVPPSSYADTEVTSPTHRDIPGESNIPFAIPLHPTPKTYRSQSYSVGQFEPESIGPQPATTTSTSYFPSNGGRMRSAQPSGLQHRPSRPSMLSEMSSDGPGLGQLQEVDDDDEGTNCSSPQGAQIHSAEERTIQMLTRENALLRQAAAAADAREQRLRNRPAMASHGSNSALRAASDTRSIQGSLPEEGSDYAVDENDDVHELQGFGRQHLVVARRFSEAQVDSQHGGLSSMGMPVNNKLENLKKGHWQSSLGFGAIDDIPQSRRHSFADAPTPRHPSTSSSASIHGLGVGVGMQPAIGANQDRASVYSDGSGNQQTADNRESTYFHSRFDKYAQPAIEYGNANDMKFAAEYFAFQGHYKRLINGRSNPNLQTNGPFTHSRANQVLYVVTFKCSRSEIFYISENTGLEVKAGDMVVVEADRGTDLGTVSKADVSWDEAKQLKERHAEDHYRWLMMFSRFHNQPNAGGSLPQGPAPGGSAVGGMGPQGGQNGNPDSNTSDIKPKMIKRLAQAHEIQALKDKEGNEAKAKRVCQQKVAEHRLNMEILDAEFQMDWKKLTFFYYAEAYINFNTLVTDLFKVYKTRIWMSAVNPASFANPAQSLLPPSGVGPGAVLSGQDYGFDQRRRKESPPYGPLLGAYNGNAQQQDPRSNTGSYQSSPIQQTSFNYTFQPFGQLPRQPAFGLTDYPVAQPQGGAAPFAMPQYPGATARAFQPTFGGPQGVTVPQRSPNYPGAGEGYVDSFGAMTLRGVR